MQTITIGKENAKFQEILALKNNRTKRAQLKKFFVEGVQNIKDAISFGWDIDSFIYTDRNKLSDWAKGILKLAHTNYCLTDELMKKLSDKTNTSELLAIVKVKEFCGFDSMQNPLIVLLDRPSKKGNFGSIIRSCDALFVDQILFIGHSVDIFDHEVITSSMGSFFKVPFRFIKSNEEFKQMVNDFKQKYNNFQVIATSLKAQTLVQKCDFSKPTLLLIGNEAKGLSKFLLDTADEFVKINMNNMIDSLNVACATTACLYEISRQRLEKNTH